MCLPSYRHESHKIGIEKKQQTLQKQRYDVRHLQQHIIYPSNLYFSMEVYTMYVLSTRCCCCCWCWCWCWCWFWFWCGCCFYENQPIRWLSYYQRMRCVCVCVCVSVVPFFLFWFSSCFCVDMYQFVCDYLSCPRCGREMNVQCLIVGSRADRLVMTWRDVTWHLLPILYSSHDSKYHAWSRFQWFVVQPQHGGCLCRSSSSSSSTCHHTHQWRGTKK